MNAKILTRVMRFVPQQHPTFYTCFYNKEEIFEGFDSVMAKVKKRKVPKWDEIL